MFLNFDPNCNVKIISVPRFWPRFRSQFEVSRNKLKYQGTLQVHTIPPLKTHPVETLKGRDGTFYPCLGQCGIVSCGFKSLNISSLRRHIKERCTAAIKYSNIVGILLFSESLIICQISIYRASQGKKNGTVYRVAR